ncbi:MAG: hypothetical protein LW823_03635 [Rickettsiales bacterium]|jgi:hypothetical protein|nr:hypothetical protein [Rickettsiales bacterium]
MKKEKHPAPSIEGLRALRIDDARMLSKRIEHFAQSRGLKTIHAQAEFLGINYQTLLNILETERCGTYDVTLKLCDKLGISTSERRKFFEDYSDYHFDAQHVLDDLKQKKILFSKALSDLSQFSDKPLAELFAPLSEEKRTPLSTIKQWMRTGSDDLPPLSKIRILATKVFDLSRQQQELLCECAGCFVDLKHLEKKLVSEPPAISAADAARGLITLCADSTTAYARNKKIDPETASRWASGKATRKALINLLKEAQEREETTLDINAQRKLLERHGFYLNIEHVMEKFKDSAKLYDFIDAIKSTLEMTDADFGVQEGTVQRGRGAKALTKEETAATYFHHISMSPKAPPDIKSYWDTYKNIAARYLSIPETGQQADLFDRNMNETLAGLSAQRQ